MAGRGPTGERWSLKALESSLELEIMEPFSFKTFTFQSFRNFLYFAQSHGSFDAIAFLLPASRSSMPFFNSELILGAFFILARLVRSGARELTTSKKFVFQSAY